MAYGVAAGLLGAGVAGIFVGGFTVAGSGSSTLMVAGVGAIATGITMETLKGAAQFSSKVNQLSSIKQKIAVDNQGLILLKTVKGQLYMDLFLDRNMQFWLYQSCRKGGLH